MVTQEMLEQLRANRAQPNARLEYNIDGATHTHVVSNVEAERERKILQGENTLQEALHNMRREQSFASRDGLAKANFNQKSEGLKP